MELKRLSFAFDEVKADDDARTIEGWVSVFGNVDSGKDVVMPGAFAKSLNRRKANDKVVMLWQHDTREPIGVWDELREIDKGLYGKGTLFDTVRGNDAYKLLKGGAIKGISIGYGTKQYEMDQQKGVRKLTELELFEASLVTFPMNDKALVTRVKSEEGELIDERTFEEFLRDAGFSRKEAKTIISEGYRAIPRQRDAGAEEQTVLRELRDVLTNFRI